MQFLSFEEPAPLPARRLTTTEALALSVALHLLLLLLVLYFPSHLPGPLETLFGARAVPADVAALQAEAEASKDAAPTARKEESKIPLKFVYVKVPDDVGVRENKDARLLSDKARKARQEIPTPQYAKQFSLDPHSVGDTIDRVRPDPSRPEGPESPDPSVPQPSGGRDLPDSSGAARPGGPGSGLGSEGETADAGNVPPRDRGPGVATASPRGRTGGGPGGAAEAGPSGEGEGPGAPSRERITQALTDLKAGEYKFTFNNPAFLRNGSYGTMSFDTQDFPWGDYARRLYVIIRNSWFERIPLAAREGIAGYVCQHFVISKEGRVLEITTLRPSSIPPFDKAAADAISASNPLPPLPPGFPHGQEGVTFCFYYNMYPGEAD